MPPIEVVEYKDGEVVTPPPAGVASPRADGTSDATSPGQPDAPGAGTAVPADSPSAAAAPDAGEGSGVDADDQDLSPETATVDYVARRINRLTARLRSAQRTRELERQQEAQARAQLEGQIQMLTRVLQGTAPTGADVSEGPQGPPQSEQYQTHDDYVRALTRYEMQQERTQEQQRQQAEQQRTQVQDMQRQLQEREQAFRQTHPDFDEVIRGALVGRVAPHVQQALMVLEEGPALAYALARQPETLQRLNTLPPWQVVAELGRLAPPAASPPPAQANGAAPPAAPSAPSAAAPLTPLSGSGAPASPQAYDENMSAEQYRAYRKATSQLATWKQR